MISRGDGDTATTTNHARSAKRCPTNHANLPPLGFAGFEDLSAAAGTGRRKSRWVINPLRAAAHASAEAARFSSLEAELCAGIGRRKPE